MDIATTFFDVAVIGGGPAGAASAITLARLGRSVIILEQSSYNSPRVGETLSPTIKSLLSELGVWDSFLGTNPIPSYGIKSAWGGFDLSSSSFIFSPYGSGWQINRQRFDELLSDIAGLEGAIVLTNSRVTRIVPDLDPEKGWLIEFIRQKVDKVNGNMNGVASKKISLHSKAVINATGRNSISLQKLGAKQILYDNLVGLAVRFQGVDVPRSSFTLIEASEKGWWYSTPVPKNSFSVVFMTDVDVMVQNHFRRIHDWMKLFNKTEHTKARCAGCRLLAGPKTFSASSRRLTRSQYEYKWLAVGDAALAVDPLSGSGISFALRSGRDGANAIDLWLSGYDSAARIYDEQLDEEFEQYLKNRNYYYGLETRWSGSIFWKRRSKQDGQNIQINS
jgi:flavin-dependent dehydrogenase